MEWNDNQIKIANALIEGKSAQEVATQCEASIASVYKVRQALKKAGGKIPSSNDQVIPSTVVQRTPPPPTTTAVTSEASFLEFSPKTQRFTLTPAIFMSYMCALKRGYEGDLGEWLNLIAIKVWLDRDINFYGEVADFDPNNSSRKEGKYAISEG